MTSISQIRYRGRALVARLGLVVEKKPSVFWSVVGIALPAITAAIAIFGAFTTEQKALLLSIAAFSLGNTALAFQRVYTVFRQHGDHQDQA